MSTLAPGAIVEVRTEAWRVQRTERASDGSTLLYVRGVSELVRDRDAIFIKEHEERLQKVKVLAPESTELKADSSPKFRDTMLHMESLLRAIPPTDDRLYVGHKAAMDVLNYQLEPAKIALSKPRQRILIADAVGLGKTLECGILLSELIQRGRGKRILVVAIKSMLAQFQKEMWSRFTIPLVRLDSVGLKKIRREIPTNQNPFYYFDKTIISMDTLKQNNEYKVHLENAYWDIIVIDEAHNVAVRGKNQSQRSELAELLSRRSDTLVMLSATPHDGRPESFASLMNMLDPTAIADESHYTPEDIDGLFIRRFKKDIAHEVKANFPEREIRKASATASHAEEAAFDALANLKFQKLDQHKSGSILFKTTLEKALLSSPAACKETIRNRLKNLEAREDDASLHDHAALQDLLRAVEEIEPGGFSKYQRLLEILNGSGEFKWTGKRQNDRLVIFTERIETLKFLEANLKKDLNLGDDTVRVLHGGLSDIDQQVLVEEFGKENSKLRLLIASDVASEGINLHYQCHRLIHFDIPWSLMVFRQRNGRVDRYGQTEKPLLLYLFTESNNPKVQGDNRVLDLLVQKDEQATRNIGDPSALLGVYDVDAEEAMVAEVMQGDVSYDAFANTLEAGMDIFDLFLQKVKDGTPAPGTPAPKESLAELSSLFASQTEYLKAALNHLEVHFEMIADSATLRLEAPDELIERFELLPDEIYPTDGHLELTEDSGLMQRLIQESRSEENAWPKVQHLWPLSPVLSWVNDRVSGIFGRHAAPVLVKDTDGECVTFVVSGLIPNQKSQPIVHEWFGIVFESGRFQRVEPFDQTRERTNLSAEHINYSTTPDLDALKALLPEACAKAREQMSARHSEFKAALSAKLDEELLKLDALEKRQKTHVENRYAKKTTARDLMNREREERAIKRVFEEYVTWTQESFKTEDHPFIQVIAVIVG